MVRGFCRRSGCSADDQVVLQIVIGFCQVVLQTVRFCLGGSADGQVVLPTVRWFCRWSGGSADGQVVLQMVM